MKLIKYQGRTPKHLDSFPSDAERSKAGALHLLPGHSYEISDDEYAYIKANKKELAKKILLLKEV